MPWPDVEEFTHFLQASGLYGLNPSASELLLDLQGALNAAVDKWNDTTHYWPFLSTGLEETRLFTPGGTRLIDLNGGLVRFVSLSTDITYDATNSTTSVTSGTERVNIRDFRLMPADAPQRKKPYTYILSAFWGRGIPGSIAITGEWGYCTDANLPSAARRAVMAMAALELLPQIMREMAQGGLSQLQRGDEMKRWAEPGKMAADWQALVDAALKCGGYVRQRVA